MKIIFLTTVLFLSFSLHAQTGLQRTYSSGVQNIIAGLIPYSNGYAVAGISNFGYDSSWLHLILLNADGNVAAQQTWRGALPLTFMDHAAGLTSGFLVCGVGSPNLGDFHPYLIKTDNSGIVQWSKWFDNLGFSSHQLNAIVTNGNAFSVYSYPDGGTQGFYRIEGDETGSSFSAVSATNPSGNMRISNAVPFSTVSDHLLIASGGLVPNVHGSDGLLIKMNPSGVSWSKLFHFGSIISEEFTDAVISAGDNPIAVAYSQNDTTTVVTSFVMKLTSSGAITWCRKLALGSILEMFTIEETSSGDLLVAGIDANYGGILIKLSSIGDLIWARRWTPSAYTLTYFTKIHRDASTNDIIVSGTHDAKFMVLHLDENGDGCEFENITGMQVNDFTPVLQDLPLTVSGFTPTTQTETLHDRTSAITIQDVCQTGIEPAVSGDHPGASPNPAHDVITVSLPSSFAKASLNLFDATGRKVYSAITKNTRSEITVTNMQRGIYLLEIISDDKQWREKIMVQ